jgi:hypothetical protein
LTVLPPANSDADFTLTVTAIAAETNPTSVDTTVSVVSASVQATIDITVTAVVDPIGVDVSDAQGNEGDVIPLSIVPRFTDLDGSETIVSVSIGNIPAVATVYVAGSILPVVNGTVEFVSGIDDISIVFDDNGVYDLTVLLTTSELTVPDVQASVGATIRITVNNVVPSGELVTVAGSNSISIQSVFDPSGVDTQAGFTYQFDLDGDGTFETTTNSNSAVTSAVNGLLRGRVIDKDGGVSETLVLRGNGLNLLGFDNNIAGLPIGGYPVPTEFRSAAPQLVPSPVTTESSTLGLTEDGQTLTETFLDLGASGGDPLEIEPEGWFFDLVGTDERRRFGPNAQSLPPLDDGSMYRVILPDGETTLEFRHNDGVADFADVQDEFEEYPGLEDLLRRLLPGEFDTIEGELTLPDTVGDGDLSEAFWSDLADQPSLASAGLIALAIGMTRSPDGKRRKAVDRLSER